MSESLLKMLGTCVAWGLSYLIILYITNKMGVGYNVLKNSLKWLVQLKKLCASLHAQLAATGFSQHSRGTINCLKKVVRCERGIARILTVYIFDNRDDKDVSQAMELISSIPDYARKAAAIASEASSSNANAGDNDRKNSELDAVFSKIDDCIARAGELIKNAIDRDMKEELLRV